MTSTTADLEWTTDGVSEQYRLQVYSNSGGTTQVGSNQDLSNTMPPEVEPGAWTITGLTTGTQYWFRLSPMVDGAVQQVCSLQTFTTS